MRRRASPLGLAAAVGDGRDDVGRGTELEVLEQKTDLAEPALAGEVGRLEPSAQTLKVDRRLAMERSGVGHHVVDCMAPAVPSQCQNRISHLS